MNRKYKKLLISSAVLLPIAVVSASAFAEVRAITEQSPSYLDQQQASVVSKSNLLADTSAQAYTEEFTKPFGGFYIGLGANWVNTDLTLDVNVQSEPPAKSFSDKGDGLGGNINFGYGADLHNFYIGGEVFFGLNQAKSIDNIKIATLPNSGNSNSTLEVKSFDYGADVRFGYIFVHNFMAYLLAGVDTATVNNGVTNEDKTQVAFMPGIGAEFLINDNWGIRAQYTYSSFAKESGTIAEKNTNWDYQVKRSNFGLNLIYHFNF